MDERNIGELSDNQASEVLEQVKTKGADKRDILSDAEFEAIVDAVRTKDAA